MGGVMTIAPVPGTKGQFLSTRQFYSPNDGFKARIEIVTRAGKDNWQVRTLQGPLRTSFRHPEKGAASTI